MTSLGLATLVGRFAVACSGNGDAPAMPVADGPNPEEDGSANLDGSAADVAPLLPSFCNGIVLYASFDSTLTPELGTTQPVVGGFARLTPAGHFGGGLELRDDAGLLDGGAALYLVRVDGGPPVFPESQGTLSIWYSGIPTAAMPVLYRPVVALPPAPLETAGLALAGFPPFFGLVHQPPGGGQTNILAFQKTSVRPYLDDVDFNHFVTAWRRGDAGGAPTAMMALNGGLGKIFDAGPDAPDYSDASPTEAGALLVPYRGYASTTWDYDASVSPIALRIGGTSVNAPQGIADDLAVWDRVLSFDEMAAMYDAKQPIAAVCHLKAP